MPVQEQPCLNRYNLNVQVDEVLLRLPCIHVWTKPHQLLSQGLMQPRPLQMGKRTRSEPVCVAPQDECDNSESDKNASPNVARSVRMQSSALCSGLLALQGGVASLGTQRWGLSTCSRRVRLLAHIARRVEGGYLSGVTIDHGRAGVHVADRIARPRLGVSSRVFFWSGMVLLGPRMLAASTAVGACWTVQ